MKKCFGMDIAVLRIKRKRHEEPLDALSNPHGKEKRG
jgi:hypothetical protein